MPEHEGSLKERLDNWLATKSAADDHEATLWCVRITPVGTAALHELGFDTEEQRAKRLGKLRAQLGIEESESPNRLPRETE